MGSARTGLDSSQDAGFRLDFICGTASALARLACLGGCFFVDCSSSSVVNPAIRLCTMDTFAEKETIDGVHGRVDDLPLARAGKTKAWSKKSSLTGPQGQNRNKKCIRFSFALLEWPPCPPRGKIHLQDILASLSVTCPKCGRVIQPAEIRRVNFEEMSLPAVVARASTHLSRSRDGADQELSARKNRSKASKAATEVRREKKTKGRKKRLARNSAKLYP